MSGATITFRAHGMHCHGCEHVIEASLRKLAGVRRAAASYPTETVVVDYDDDETDFTAIYENVEANGYRVESDARPKSLLARLALIAAALAALAGIILIDHRWISAGGAPDIAQHLDLWLIFLLGLVTGFHCIGMCGAFVVSYATAAADAGRSAVAAHLFYAAGKTLSYTVIGALFGAVGAFVAFTPLLRGAAGVAAGLFLIVFGLNMLGLFKPLRRFRLGLPAPLERWVHHEAGARHRPFVIGLLNGLMIACGPLQAMYIMAAGTGSALEGARMLFAFGLGTLPVMLAFGAVASLLSSAVTHRLLRASGVIVVALGAVMINRGLILTGWGVDLAAMVSRLERVEAPPAPAPTAGAVQTIVMEANGLGYQPARFTLTRGVPVDWVVDATELTECNRRIEVPALGLVFDLKPGRQTFRFTPTQSGVIAWSCWMGMLRGQFDVVEPGAVPPPVAPEPPAPCARCREKKPPQTYIVQKGDSLARIAKNLYGDPARAKDIAAANPDMRPSRLKPGATLILPPPRP
jgi:uncharacterized protein